MEITTIYKEFHRQLLVYIRSKIRSREDAEDILQNVFVKVSSNIDNLRGDEKLKNWIFTITRNTVIDYYRSKAVNKAIAVGDEIGDTVFESDVPDSTLGLDACMTTMISLLPEEYRDIIIDSEIKGIKQKDLVDKYGIAYSSVRSRIQRGRERLKQLFYNCCQIKTDVFGNIIETENPSACEGSCSPCSEE